MHGIKRESSTNITEDKVKKAANLHFHFCDMTDYSKLLRFIKPVCPDKYITWRLKAMHISFDRPEYTVDINTLGTLHLLETIRTLGLEKKTKFFQASSGEFQ